MNFKEEDWLEVQVKNDEIWDRKGTLIGKYISVQSEVGPNKSNMYTLKTDEGTVGVWGSTVIDGKFANIPIGSMVKLEPRGKSKSKQGKEYWDFGIYHIPGSAPDQPEDPFEGEEMPPDFLQEQ